LLTGLASNAGQQACKLFLILDMGPDAVELHFQHVLLVSDGAPGKMLQLH